MCLGAVRRRRAAWSLDATSKHARCVQRLLVPYQVASTAISRYSSKGIKNEVAYVYPGR